jgi:hypothetical protein
MLSLSMLAHANFFYLKSYKLIVYAVQFTSVCIFSCGLIVSLHSHSCTLAECLTDIRLGTSDYLSFKKSTVFLILICTALAWKSPNNLHFEQSDCVASNLGITGLVSQAISSTQMEILYKAEIVSPFLMSVLHQRQF